MHKRLRNALPNFYAAIIVFLVKVRVVFEPSLLGKKSRTRQLYVILIITASVGNATRPFSIQFGEYLNDIEHTEKEVKRLSDLATQKGVQGKSLSAQHKPSDRECN